MRLYFGINKNEENCGITLVSVELFRIVIFEFWINYKQFDFTILNITFGISFDNEQYD